MTDLQIIAAIYIANALAWGYILGRGSLSTQLDLGEMILAATLWPATLAVAFGMRTAIKLYRADIEDRVK